MVICQAVSSKISTELPLEDLYGICADAPLNIDDSSIADALDEDLPGAFE